MGVARGLLQHALRPIECHLSHRVQGQESYPAIFLLGSPRSGSTLLSQALIQYFRIGYISNFTRNFYSVPLTGSWIQRHLLKRSQESGYGSDFGRTGGLLGPNEAASFWYQWFPGGDDVYVEEGFLPKKSIEEIRCKIRGLTRLSQSPVLFKNLYNSMRIQAIYECLPDSLFLICHRDVLDTAQSIMKSRQRVQGDIREWWSVPPREYAMIKDHAPHHQVVEQVYYIYRQIEKDLKAKPDANVYHLQYEMFCHHPAGSLDNFAHWCETKGVRPERKADLPESFAVSTGRRVDGIIYDEMKELLARIERQNGT